VVDGRWKVLVKYGEPRDAGFRFEIAAVVQQAIEKGETPPPRLLYTETELREVRKLQAIAHVEHEELRKGDGGDIHGGNVGERQ